LNHTACLDSRRDTLHDKRRQQCVNGPTANVPVAARHNIGEVMNDERSQRQPDEDKPAGNPVKPLRILEIGDLDLFVLAVPEQTEFYWTGTKPRQRGKRALGPIRMIRSLGKLRRGEFDLLVVHTTQYPPWHLRSILTALRDWGLRAPLGLFAIFAWRFVHLLHNVPIAVLDLNDPCRIGSHNFFLLDRCKAFFKRELPSDPWLAFCKSSYPNFPGRRWRSNERNRKRVGKLKPISLGSHPISQEISSPAKSTDIFFAGAVSSNNWARPAGLNELRALAAEGYVVDIATERLTRQDFLSRTSAAWLAWSPPGLGWDCTRHYEAPVVGSVPLITYPSIMRHRPLLDGEHCVLYRPEAGGLADAARKALTDKAHLRKMAAAAGDLVRNHHSYYARAEYVTATVLGQRLDGSRIEETGAPADQFQAVS
jgi:Glycosyl transferases group 1